VMPTAPTAATMTPQGRGNDRHRIIPVTPPANVGNTSRSPKNTSAGNCRSTPFKAGQTKNASANATTEARASGPRIAPPTLIPAKTQARIIKAVKVEVSGHDFQRNPLNQSKQRPTRNVRVILTADCQEGIRTIKTQKPFEKVASGEFSRQRSGLSDCVGTFTSPGCAQICSDG
jgi:hypothetical protein